MLERERKRGGRAANEQFKGSKRAYQSITIEQAEVLASVQVLGEYS